jgi:5'-nucleotidase
MLAELPAEPQVINVNVPNRALADLAGWRRTEVALLPPRTLASAQLTPKLGHDDAFDVRMEWGDPIELPVDTDSGAVEAGFVAVTALSRMLDDQASDLSAVTSALEAVVPT